MLLFPTIFSRKHIGQLLAYQGSVLGSIQTHFY